MENFDDDTHFCLKCHSTIIGLDFYVSHRKNNCMKPPDETFPTLKADDFFSSLELQSSSKKLIQQSTSGKHSVGILTRSKVTAFKEPLEPSKSGKNAWIAGIPEKELDFDENQGSYEKSVNGKDVGRTKDISRLHDYADSDMDSEDYDLDEETTDEDAPPRNHTGGKWKPSSPIYWKPINSEAEWRAPPPSFTGGKWKPIPNKRPFSPSDTRGKSKPGHQSQENEYQMSGGKWGPTKKPPVSSSPDFTKEKLKYKSYVPNDRDVYHSSPEPNDKCKFSSSPEIPPSYTKGKWKPGSGPSESIPSSYTKGKWKPTSSSPDPIPASYTKGKWKPESSDLIPSSYTKGKWKPETPSDPIPSSYTKGKWKPGSSPPTVTKTKSENSDNDAGSTKDSSSELEKNRWLAASKSSTKDSKQDDDSPFVKSSGSVQYWCKPCNRRLASKIVYERHLKSEFHFRRTVREKELGENLNFIKVPRGEKRKSRETLNQKEEENPTKKRNRRKVFEKCQVCNSRVSVNLMGKHLISHYHCRKSDLASDSAQSMIFEYFHSIIQQSPFQCKSCKFYFNNHKDFLSHWLSEDHIANTTSTEGEFFCSYCKFSCVENDKMYEHLTSQNHDEVVSVINRSVPIIIKKVYFNECDTCKERFQLKIQLKKHVEKSGHQISGDELKEFRCDICSQNLQSDKALQRHKKFAHKVKSFLCGTCGLTFADSKEAKEHRNSEQHHYTSLEKRNSEAGKTSEKKCQYCPLVFENFLKLKDHIRDQHKEFHTRCPRCAMSFVVPQDLSVHLRTKSCKLEEQAPKKFSCSTCPFSVDSEAQLLFHEALHLEPIHMYPDNDPSNDKKTTPNYKCPKCQRFFPKSSLLGHLRIHTKERPYKCSFCDLTFVRKNNWIFHEKKHTSGKSETKEAPRDVNERPYLCSTCGASFRKRFILQQHMKIHTGKSFKCLHKDCIFTGRSFGELKIHFQTHFDERNFPCESCDYKGKTKQQLQRHMTVHEETKKFKCPSCPFTARTSHHLKRHTRLHTGSKPYNCPHCTYSSNSLENLRKHILSTSKHPGKSIYECKFCNGDRFQTNFFKEFKAHLLTLHPNEMDKGDKIKSSSVYEAKKDQFFPIGNAHSQLKTGESSTNLPQPESKSLQIIEEGASLPCSLQLVPLIVSKEDSIEDTENGENWSLVECYDVSESGALVAFNKDILFEEIQ